MGTWAQWLGRFVSRKLAAKRNIRLSPVAVISQAFSLNSSFRSFEQAPHLLDQSSETMNAHKRTDMDADDMFTSPPHESASRQKKRCTQKFAIRPRRGPSRTKPNLADVQKLVYCYFMRPQSVSKLTMELRNSLRIQFW